MRRFTTVSMVLGLSTLLAWTACTDTVSSTPGPDPTDGTDAGRESDAKSPAPDAEGSSSKDAGADAEAPFTKQTEAEPNNATSKTDLGTMTLPGEMTGKIDPANDIDAFSLSLTPGELWEWTLAADDDLAPHLVVFDTAAGTLNPTRLAQGASSGTITLAQFVLRPGTFAAIVRDARNVAKPPAGVGGPTFGYTLSAKKKTLTSVPVTFPTTKTGSLASLSSLDFYAFSGNQGIGFDVVLKAKRKAAPSTLDSRISLFNLTSKSTVLTNDDAAGSTDSEIGGSLPATADYLLIVENEGTDDADLSYELSFTLR